MHKQIKGTLQLSMAAFIWGLAFVAQSVGMEHVGPWTFICIRYILGALILLPLIRAEYKLTNRKETAPDKKAALKGGIICGIFLVSASYFQQYGIMETSVGKAGFITTLYIIIVPFLSVFLHRRIGINEWISAVIALVGFYIMSISGYSAINRGDIMLLICAFLFSMQILSIDRYVSGVDPVVLSCIEFAVSAIVGAAGMVFFEKPSIYDIKMAAIPLLYTGICSTAIAYTLQVMGQRNLKPTIASLLMSLESVFAALGGYVILHQTLSMREIIGCILVFTGVILAQLRIPQKAKENK